MADDRVITFDSGKESEYGYASKHTKMRKETEKISLIEGSTNENAKLKENQIEDSKLWQEFNLKVSSTKTLFYQLTLSLRLRDSQVLQAQEGKINEIVGKISTALDHLNCVLVDLSKGLDWAIQTIIPDRKSTVELEPESPVPNTLRRFHTTAYKNMGKRKKMQLKDSKDESYPGNTYKIVLNPQNLSASKRSYKRGIKKMRAWCHATSDLVADLSKLFGPGAKVSPNPADGVFHLTVELDERQLTFFIYGRDLYLKGWNGDRFGTFVVHPHNLDKEKCFMKVSDWRKLNIPENYRRLCRRGLENTGIGPFAMIEAFEILHKCNGVVTSEVLRAICTFIVNTSEPARSENIFQEILEAFDRFDLYYLDQRKPLSLWCRSYSYYSKQYLECVDCFIRGEPMPEIINRRGITVKSLSELYHQIKVPHRDSYSKGVFSHEKCGAATWSPPYADGVNWTSEEDDEEKGEELEEEEEVEEEEKEVEEEEKEVEKEVEEEVEDNAIISYPGRLNCIGQGFSSAAAGSVEMSASSGMTMRPHFAALTSGWMRGSNGIFIRAPFAAAGHMGASGEMVMSFTAAGSSRMLNSSGMISRATSQCRPAADQSGFLCRALLRATRLLKWLPR